ncbi:MAG: hypothetical protein B7Z68_03045 [Acidobacteria bacterium 21-70-11]|nr:MAG: hypothetical protein B7Z68_03045 [Acidobacteria bacterium 21-70-11]
MSDHAVREEAIIATALELAENRGVAGVTTAALARNLEFTEAALYRYFPSKGAIIAATLRHLGNRLFATMMLELMPEAVGHGHAIHSQLERHIQRFTLKSGLLVELLLCAAGGREQELQATGCDFLQRYGERMAEYGAAPGVRGVHRHPEDVARRRRTLTAALEPRPSLPLAMLLRARPRPAAAGATPRTPSPSTRARPTPGRSESSDPRPRCSASTGP